VKGLSILASTAAAAIESARLVETIRQLNQDLEQRVRERTAELERANRAKDHFLATMSHELRTPLNAILGFTGTLLMKLPGPLTADQEKQLRTVQRSGKHLLSLINDMLDLARIESGKVELKPEPMVLQHILQEAIGILRPLADSKSLLLEVEVPENPLALLTDARAFNQVLLNLANNAIKFTDRGKVRIAVRTLETNGRQTVAIDVIDTGIGISPEDQVHLFQAFTQVGNPGQRRAGGTGLGLHLSRRLAELLGGGITCKSELGQGSIFTLVLPGA
jgi:protein-histidine pros-kinase